MRFHSSDKKPKVWSLALLTLVAAAGLICILRFSGEYRLAYANLLLTVYFTVSILLLLDAFRRQLRYNLYSYNSIIYPGFSLFILSLAVTHALVTVQCFRNPAEFREEEIVFTLLHSAKNYMFLTTPFLLAFSGVLLVSNIALIRHEGRRFVNILGILLAVILVFGEVLVGALDLWSSVSEGGNLAANLLVNLLAAFYLYFECMIIGSAVADVIAARYVPDRDQDILLILGCGLRADGSPTPLLKGRADLALRFDGEQKEETGKRALFLASGGQGPDEVISEAESVRDYLISRGVEPARILIEEQSASTEENMRYSAELLRQLDGTDRIAFFTTNYHVFRAGLKAREAGLLHAVGMGAETRWYFWPNASVREFVGLLTEHRGKQAALLLGLAAVYAALTILVYG